MEQTEYHRRIVDYYRDTEHAYKDAWDLGNSMAIHYGYWDDKVRSFPESLIRMNEVMMETAGIRKGDRVLDAGCGVGGSSIYLAMEAGAEVRGISLSERQVKMAGENARKAGVESLVRFEVMNYASTSYPDAHFDVVWGCESVCYADDKKAFLMEAFRLLRPGGRLVLADGFVTRFSNNGHPSIRKWLDGWQVNYLESPERFSGFMEEIGFRDISYRDISREARHSARRLYRYYFLASMYLWWKKINFSKPATELQKGNILACRHQYRALRKGLWQYGLLLGKKP